MNAEIERQQRIEAERLQDEWERLALEREEFRILTVEHVEEGTARSRRILALAQRALDEGALFDATVHLTDVSNNVKPDGPKDSWPPL